MDKAHLCCILARQEDIRILEWLLRSYDYERENAVTLRTRLTVILNAMYVLYAQHSLGRMCKDGGVSIPDSQPWRYARHRITERNVHHQFVSFGFSSVRFGSVRFGFLYSPTRLDIRGALASNACNVCLCSQSDRKCVKKAGAR